MTKRSEDIKLVKETFLNELVIVTGCPASGKSLLAPIVASLDRTENFKMSLVLEQIGTLNHLGKISNDAMELLYKYTVDFMLYDNLIGREMNFRFGDETSVFNTNNPEKYLDRLLAERGGFVIGDMEKVRPLLVLALSDAFWHAKRWYACFSFLKMIRIDRHPVDTVYSWYNHKYGEAVSRQPQTKKAELTHGSETYDSKISQVILTHVNDAIVPNYALGCAEEYQAMSEMDRVIFMINCIFENYKKALDSLTESERKNVLLLTLDETVTNTDVVVDRICSHIGTTRTSYTDTVLKREHCPRILSEEDREQKFKKIKAKASEEAFKTVLAMIDDYEGAKAII